jgi:dihydrofolate reductase
MRKLFVTEFMTLDGVMEAPGGEPTHPHSGWVQPYFDDVLGTYKWEETRDSESLLLGRVTYESFAGAWPTYEGEMAIKMNAMHKDVVSSTLSEPEWDNTTVLSGDLVADVTALKAGEGGPIQVAGSCSLVQALLQHGLVDELHLQVFPVIIGGGLRAFPQDRSKTSFTLAETQTTPSGVVLQTYGVA